MAVNKKNHPEGKFFGDTIFGKYLFQMDKYEKSLRN